MKLLLDTHALLWALMTPERLSEAVRSAIVAPENTVLASAVCFWEVAIKQRLGKLTLTGVAPDALPEASVRQGFELLALESRVAAGFAALPDVPGHRDPFDRMLIWQAVSAGYTLVSRDRRIETGVVPGLDVLW